MDAQLLFILLLPIVLLVFVASRRVRIFAPRRSVLCEPDMAYAHGIQVGQQMIVAQMHWDTNKQVEARRACIVLVKEADAVGLGLTLSSLNEYR